MMPEPAIGGTFTKVVPSSNQLRGFTFGLLFGVVGCTAPLILSVIHDSILLAFAPASAEPAWRAQPWFTLPFIPWTTLAIYLGWTSARVGYLWQSPGTDPGILRVLRIANVAVLSTILVLSYMLPRGLNLEDDPDLRIRIVAAAGFSFSIALAIRNSDVWWR